ncbi:hypothetical protein L6452_28728 [Arctium lappa]|uniref:Uncharacterized protein n=1 Tax=Arctium lappa TaxID=4217 RepID=A0ACB8ZYD0_ARCLA|nr:hypothetical protein L6452_28728 [Arctium lappa]
MSLNTIFEERKEHMARTPNIRVLQLARFLKPTIFVHNPSPNGPFRPSSTISSLPSYLEKVNFLGWVKPQVKWMNWATSMEAANRAVWERTGIHDVVMDSMLNIPKNKKLVLFFAEKWAPETNTFVFPWGEITITLEDMMVLGGFPVLGEPVFRHVESTEDQETYNKLNKAYIKMVRTSAKKATFSAWMDKFMGRKKALEHEAFLVLWLSKYLFPSIKNTILTDTFDLAIHLARGRRIALAPAVLAAVYRDLHVLKNAIMDLQHGEKLLHEIYSPMYYLQVWVWERFPSLRCRDISDGSAQANQTRLVRWADPKHKGINYCTLESVIRAEDFVWQPYLNDTNHFISREIYKENWTLESIREGGYNEEVDSFARCLRVLKLVGLDITQRYFPHRVSKQFGYDQDIPGDVMQPENKEDSVVES